METRRALGPRRRAVTRAASVASAAVALGLALAPAASHSNGPARGDTPNATLLEVVAALEDRSACRLARSIGWRKRACPAPTGEGPFEHLVEDLDRLAWGDPPGDEIPLHGFPGRTRRALACQWAIARTVEATVRRAAFAGDDAPVASRPRRSRRGRAPRRSVSGPDLARRCAGPIAMLGPNGPLPRVGRGCSPAIDPTAGSVDARALRHCLDVLTGALLARHLPEEVAPSRRRPNLVVILADDQRADALGRTHAPDAGGELPAMPVTVDRLAGEGVSFSRAYATSPVCAPSRAALFTAQYAGRNGVYRNEGLGGGAFFGDRDTLARWLQEAGYRTGFFGKYMNQYPLRWASPLRAPTPPPGWDDWRAFDHPGSVPHFGFRMVENGVAVQYADDRYSTDVIAEQALEFLSEAGAGDRPFLLWLSVATPHHPWTPAPRHFGLFDDGPPFSPPNLFEADVSDKPDWVGALQPGTLLRRLGAELVRRRQLEMQLSVDELVGALMARLDALGLTDETVVVYTSDNGQAWGEHRWLSKGCPWEACTRVPLVVRYPPLAPLPRVEPALFSLVDLPVTLAALAGAPLPPERDGRSRIAAIDGSERDAPESVVIEAHVAPTLEWAALREARFKLIEYRSGALELYDLETDPYELDSLAERPELRSRLDDMRRRLAEQWAGPRR